MQMRQAFVALASVICKRQNDGQCPNLFYSGPQSKCWTPTLGQSFQIQVNNFLEMLNRISLCGPSDTLKLRVACDFDGLMNSLIELFFNRFFVFQSESNKYLYTLSLNTIDNFSIYFGHLNKANGGIGYWASLLDNYTM